MDIIKKYKYADKHTYFYLTQNIADFACLEGCFESNCNCRFLNELHIHNSLILSP